jgi:hypothetical protein
MGATACGGDSDEYFTAIIGDVARFAANPNDSETEAICKNHEWALLMGVHKQDGYFTVTLNTCESGSYELVDPHETTILGVTGCEFNSFDSEVGDYTAYTGYTSSSCNVTVQWQGSYAIGSLNGILVGGPNFYDEVIVYAEFKLSVEHTD